VPGDHTDGQAQYCALKCPLDLSYCTTDALSFFRYPVHMEWTKRHWSASYWKI